MLFRVSLRLQSSQRSCDDLADLVALKPTDSFGKGLPVSSRNPSGPVHKVSTCVFESSVAVDQPLDLHVDALAAALEQLRVKAPEDVSRDLVIAAEGRSLGSMLDLAPASIRLLARAGCGIVLDLYNDPELES